MNPSDIFKSSLFGQSSPAMVPSQSNPTSLFAGPSGSFGTATPTLQSSVPTPSSSIPTGPQSKLPSASTGSNVSATAPATPKDAYINSQTGTTATTAPSTAPVTTTTGVNPNAAYQGNTISAPIDTSSPQYQYQQAFNAYLQSLQPTDAETAATNALNAQTLQSQKDNEDALDKPGQTLGFATGEAARVAKNNAFQTDALTNTVNALTGARTARTTATQAQLDFEKGLYDDATAAAKPDYTTVGAGGTVFDNKSGQAVYTAPTTATQNGTTGGAIGGTYVPGADPTADGYVAAINAKQATLAQVPAAYKGLVAQGLASSGQASDLKTDALTSAQQLLQSFTNSSGFLGIGGAKAAVGASSVLPVIPGTQEADFVNNLNNLKSLLSLDNVKYLKGQGAISDSERQLLADSATQLSRSQSEGEFQTTLQGIIDSLSAAESGGSAPASSGAGATSGVTPSGISYTITQ